MLQVRIRAQPDLGVAHSSGTCRMIKQISACQQASGAIPRLK
jgi:hypothetical protein